ncbi:polysaccharide deacetylase family protein [Paenibacillus ehimensis]|uniref:polysaccharide deacetylase family protein n=1 Tax=Paenibacillus ehimensis TaxID=79264 RepID=UPI0013E3BFB8|nr:polysaccharide deacetylase family protein [Paenibacillus ehimensis]MEC0213769.1 polysaccharide deacetylase family protein [Paenibacillus ehimensis]
MIIYQLPSRERQIALTFDDGPNPVYTPQILDLFKKHQAYATFFVIGSYAKQYPDLLRRMVEEGHEIGNHTYSHPALPKCERQEVYEELETTNGIIQEITGIKPSLFRPPYGEFNKHTVEAADRLGLHTVIWPDHQNTKDWSLPGADTIVERVLDTLQTGDIILFHDGSGDDAGEDRSQTVQAIEKLLPHLIDNNYRLVTVTRMMRNYNEAMALQV